MNIENKISFQTLELKKWEEHKLLWKEIITVISWKIIQVLTHNQLEKLQSSLFMKWNIFTAAEDSFLTIVSLIDESIDEDIVQVWKEYWEYCRKNWKSVFEEYGVLEWTDLYKSSVITKVFQWITYKFNFWFCWPEVDCGIHNIHDFIEIHTSILWDGRMEKFLDNQEKTLLEKVYMRPGLSHRTFNKVWRKDENWNPIYPFHRWKGWEKWDIWLAIEKY